MRFARQRDTRSVNCRAANKLFIVSESMSELPGDLIENAPGGSSDLRSYAIAR
jgi:hypothetical protein